ncbi:hypothetical protein M8C21_012621, partial [Ambrosia artemisiifolia]
MSSNMPMVLITSHDVIFNKIDLVPPDDKEELEKEIYSINSLANIVHSVSMQLIWNRQLLEENKNLTTKDLHDSGVRTMCISDSHQLDLDKIWYLKHDMDVYRCKGVLNVVNSDELHTVQGGKSSRTVNCILALKSCHEWKQTGANGTWKFCGNVIPVTFSKKFIRKNSKLFKNSLSRNISMNEASMNA